ncbi:MAG TPA: hypothetical protein VF576_02130 [Rubricoccaceae bacterium]
MRCSLAVVVALAALAGGCKGRPSGVAVTEAPPVGFPSAPGRYTDGDTTYADSAYAFSDTLAASDSLARPPEVAADSTPDFDVFWGDFRAALRLGRPANVEALAAGPAVGRSEAARAAFAEPFRSGLLALTPRDLTRDGDARVARAVVGYDAEGNVVPQDEADTDSAVVLRFEVVGGGWRLVRVDLPGPR